MNPDESEQLVRRVNDLETEVHALRMRVSALEGAKAGTPAVTKVEAVLPAAVPVAPRPQDVPRRAAVPPPLPPPVPVPPQATVLPGASISVLPSTPVVPRVVPAKPVEPARPSAVHELLGALRLLPPSGSRSGEAQIGAWWATRIGALLLVIGVVFFGVYISLRTPPWVKLVELAAISGGMALAGLWIERRMERLGSVIVGAGLALCFFTAFAAYAVPAVKVIESITAAAMLQALAVVAIGGVALWRRSSTVGTMAVALGFVSAFFSLAEGFDDFAVVAGLGLSAMAVFFRHRESWPAPALVSAALVHPLNALVAIQVWDTEAGRRGPLFAFLVVGAAFGLHLLSVMLEGGDEKGRIAFIQRWIQAVNTSLAVLSGLAVAMVVLPREHLSWYFFGSGAVLIAAAAWAWRAVREDGIFSMFAVKASSLIALGVITEWDARTRWMALIVQAAVLMAAARRTGRISLAVTSVLAWLVSLLFFGDDVSGLRGRLVSGDGAAVALYVLGGAGLLAWVSRWLQQQERAKSAGAGVGWVMAVGAALPVGMTIAILWMEPWAIVACVVVSVLLILMARAMHAIVPAVGAVLAMLAAHGIVQIFDEHRWGLGWLWAGATLIAMRSAALAWLAGRRTDGNRAAWWAAASLLTVLAIAAFGGAIMQSIATYPALALTVVVAAGVVVLGQRADREDLTVAGLLAFPVALLLNAWHRPVFFVGTGGASWLWVAAAGVPVALVVLARDTVGLRGAAVARALAGVSGVVLAWRAADESLGTLGFGWSMLAAAVVYAAIGRGRGCVVSQVASSALLVLAAWRFVARESWSMTDGAWPALVVVFVILMALAAAPLVHAASAGWLSPALCRAWRVLHAVAAVGGLLLVATRSGAAWESYGRVVWALGGVVLFVLGLVFRARSHRVAGLATLGLCIPRVFIYDIQSTSHRIAAFAVLGVLLLVVGFSYQKFRHLIDGDSGKE